MRAPVTTTRACCDRRTAAGLTLVELLVVVAVVAVVLMLAAPSFRGMIETQRLRGINAQFVTDGNPLGLAWQIDGWGLTQGQALSLPMIAVGLWCMLRARQVITAKA